MIVPNSTKAGLTGSSPGLWLRSPRLVGSVPISSPSPNEKRHSIQPASEWGSN